jgi:ferredoxin
MGLSPTLPNDDDDDDTRRYTQNARYRKGFSSSSSSSSSGPEYDKMAHYLKKTLGMDDASLEKGIFQAFESIHGKNNVTLQQIQALDQEDLQALAKSVQLKLDKKAKKAATQKKINSRPSIPIVFKIPQQRHSNDTKSDSTTIKNRYQELQVSWMLGDSLLTVVQNNKDILGEYIEGTCGGTMSCTTCHIYLEQDDFYRAVSNGGEKPNDLELDMMDLAYEPKEHCSRLGCQVKLTPVVLHALKCSLLEPVSATNRFEVTIPPGVYDVWEKEH